ncbi:uncharacterized protein LOC128863991 [Anastrepha ludens]|uniref:uncharacterized protein LOC128863991 n=1 Tax=Anastrepha ludens TaxID=28586 RepID=UPI0023B13CD7|nr:uncharacterized protein LOC128863991 [Anastrepha ludens]XP_053959423.1 uncharacterized protein LOC128863991 [Anastrepha ludens]
MAQKVRKRLERNPRRSANQIAKELKISDHSIRHILKNDLKVKPYKIQQAHDLTPKQQLVRLERAKELLRFAESGKFPPQVMVWATVTTDGRSAIVFIKPGVKENVKYYRESFLSVALKLWDDKHFVGRPWTFQQDQMRIPQYARLLGPHQQSP